MPFYHRAGDLPRKRHIAHRTASGAILHEELMGNMGFTGPSALLYHLRPPTRIREVRLRAQLRWEADEDARLRPRHFSAEALERGGSPTLDRVPLLFNGDCAISFVHADRSDEHFFRNAQGDEVIYVAAGEGSCETPFGTLAFRAGDQLVLHRGMLYRLRLTTPTAKLLCIESKSYVRWPRRYRGDNGQLLEGAPFSERDIRQPAWTEPVDEEGEFVLVVKHHNALTDVILAHHPCDVVGWDGTYYPWAFSVHDFEPLVGAIHQPPPVHQFLQSDGFVLCNFVPRPFDFHPGAIPAPYNHANVMSDEVLYYASEEFMSRRGIAFGSLTLHPDGLPHGPHPGRYESSIGKERTDELAIMVDTFKPLRVAKAALGIEDGSYVQSWLHD